MERYGSRWVGGHRGWWGWWQNRELPSHLKASMFKKLKNTCSPNVNMSRDLVLSQLECPISDGCLSRLISSLPVPHALLPTSVHPESQTTCRFSQELRSQSVALISKDNWCPSTDERIKKKWYICVCVCVCVCVCAYTKEYYQPSKRMK